MELFLVGVGWGMMISSPLIGSHDTSLAVFIVGGILALSGLVIRNRRVL